MENILGVKTHNFVAQNCNLEVIFLAYVQVFPATTFFADERILVFLHNSGLIVCDIKSIHKLIVEKLRYVGINTCDGLRMAPGPFKIREV